MRLLAATLAVLALTLAVRSGDGTGSPAALAWLAVAIVALVAAAVGRPALRVTPHAAGAIGTTALAALLVIHLVRPPTILVALAPAQVKIVAGAVVIAVALAAAAQWLPRRWNVLLLVGVLTAGGFAWVWTLVSTRSVYNDVIAFHRTAAEALRRGINPYATFMPDIYGPGSTFYAPGMVVDGWVQYGYVYPPVALLLTAAGHALGDVRWMLAAAGALAAGLIALARPSPRATAAAAMFLVAAPAFYVVALGYTDVYTACAMAATVFCAARAPRATAWLLGLLLATKQYAVLLLPVVPLLVPPPWTPRRLARWAWPAALVAALLLLPPLLFDAPAYWRAVVMFQLRQPFRADSLSYLPLLGGESLRWLPLVTWAAASAAVLRWCPRTPGGFALAAALLTATFFATSHQAFANYYFFAIACACAAVAVIDERESSSPSPR